MSDKQCTRCGKVNPAEIHTCTPKQQEPVAWFTEDHREDKSATTYSKKMAGRWKEKGWPVTPLYTAPQKKEWIGLTDEEMMELYVKLKSVAGFYSLEKYARSIEAKLKEKNNG